MSSFLVWDEFLDSRYPKRRVKLNNVYDFDRTLIKSCKNGCDPRHINGLNFIDDWPWMVNEGTIVKNGKRILKPKVKRKNNNYMTIICVQCWLETEFPFFDEAPLAFHAALDAALLRWNELNCQGGQHETRSGKTGSD